MEDFRALWALRGWQLSKQTTGPAHKSWSNLTCSIKHVVLLTEKNHKIKASQAESDPAALRHPNSSAGRNLTVLSAPISVLCVLCEGKPRAERLNWPAMSTKESRQLHFTWALWSECSQVNIWGLLILFALANQLHVFVPFSAKINCQHLNSLMCSIKNKRSTGRRIQRSFWWHRTSARIVLRITSATRQTPPGVHSTPGSGKVGAAPLDQ